MKTKPLGQSGIEASVIGLGTWAIGGWLWGGTDELAAINAVRASIDQGINLIDTAPAYGFGLSEQLVARAIEGRRDEVVLATKCGLVWNDDTLNDQLSRNEQPIQKSLSSGSIRRELEASLQRLNTDRIDLYQTHWPDAETPIDETMSELLKLRDEGKIRAIGVSNVTVDILKQYLAVGCVASDQERYNMLDRKFEGDLLPFCNGHDIAFLAYSPLAMGLLTGKLGPDRQFKGDDVRLLDERFNIENRKKIAEMLESFHPIAEKYEATLSQLAIAWALAQPGMTHALVGARNPEQAAENAMAGDIELAAADVQIMSDAVQHYADSIPPLSW